jgi:hypothetical protein
MSEVVPTAVSNDATTLLKNREKGSIKKRFRLYSAQTGPVATSQPVQPNTFQAGPHAGRTTIRRLVSVGFFLLSLLVVSVSLSSPLSSFRCPVLESSPHRRGRARAYTKLSLPTDSTSLAAAAANRHRRRRSSRLRPPGPNPSSSPLPQHRRQCRRRRGERHAVPGGRAGRAAHLLRDVGRAAASRQPPRRAHLLARGNKPSALPLPPLCSSPIGSNHRDSVPSSGNPDFVACC